MKSMNRFQVSLLTALFFFVWNWIQSSKWRLVNCGGSEDSVEGGEPGWMWERAEGVASSAGSTKIGQRDSAAVSHGSAQRLKVGERVRRKGGSRRTCLEAQCARSRRFGKVKRVHVDFLEVSGIRVELLAQCRETVLHPFDRVDTEVSLAQCEQS